MRTIVPHTRTLDDRFRVASARPCERSTGRSGRRCADAVNASGAELEVDRHRCLRGVHAACRRDPAGLPALAELLHAADRHQAGGLHVWQLHHRVQQLGHLAARAPPPGWRAASSQPARRITSVCAPTLSVASVAPPMASRLVPIRLTWTARVIQMRARTSHKFRLAWRTASNRPLGTGRVWGGSLALRCHRVSPRDGRAQAQPQEDAR